MTVTSDERHALADLFAQVGQVGVGNGDVERCDVHGGRGLGR